MSRYHLAIGALPFVAIVVTAAHHGHAQDEKIAAEALFNDARTLMDSQHFAEACPKLAESQRLDPAVGTLLYLGECYDKEGKVASAWAAFKSAASAAHNAGQSSREQSAKQRASELEPRLPKLVVVVPPASEVSGLLVQRDDIDVGQVAWGSAVPVDPGKHRILAKAPGKKSWLKEIDVGSQPNVSTVTVPRLDDDPASKTGLTPAGPPSPSGAPAAGGTSQSVVVWAPPNVNSQPANARNGGRARDSATGTAMHIAGISLGTLGLVGLAVGTVYELKTQSKLQDAKSNCTNYPTDCSPQGIALNKESQDASGKATTGFIVGGGLLVTGIVVYILAPSSYVDDRSALGFPVLAPALGPHEFGMTARTRF